MFKLYSVDLTGHIWPARLEFDTCSKVTVYDC